MSKVQQRVVKVLDRMKKLASKDVGMATEFFGYLEDMLNDIHDLDGFGTEGQEDPRGDFRDGHWSMERVEGVDK